MLRYDAPSSADPHTAWALVARPDRWQEWAPHLRGARGLGRPEVRRGARGAALLLGLVPIPARIVDKVEGHSWTWRVGPVHMDHRVEPRADGGCVVAVTMHAPPPVEAALRVSYGPVVQALVKNLAGVAARGRTAPA